jgi:putative colanic acid biosynthesis acetyltransferase WcaF
MNNSDKPILYRHKNPKFRGPSFSLKNRIERFIWRFSWLIFASWTPVYLQPWRSFLLKFFGAKIGSPSDVRGSAKVWHPKNLELGDGALIAEGVNCYNQAFIKIGNRSLVSQGAFLCAGTHNIDSDYFELVAAPITICDNVWICAEAFVGPGVIINENAVLGARSVNFRNIGPSEVWVGNPAKFLRSRKNTLGLKENDV